MTFADVVGHEGVLARLAHATATGRVGGGYLFSGPAGVGKRTLAQAFTARLLCATPVHATPHAPIAGDACGTCADCRAVAAGTHPDVRTVRRDVDRRDIRTDQVRELCRWLGLRPLAAERKVGVLEGADHLNAHGQSALLKTLEEPPGASVLLLTAVHPSQLLPTVRSRCRLIRLEPLPPDVVARFLESRGLSAERARELAARSGGIPGRALALADDPHAELRATVVTALADLARADAAACSALAQRLARGPLEPALETALGWYRALLGLVLGESPQAQRFSGPGEPLRAAANRTTPERVLRQLETVYAAADAVERNLNRMLTVELMLLSLRRLEREAAASG